MSDFTTIRLRFNSNTDASPTWTNNITFGGSAGANELRFCASGAGAGGTASASWPYYSRPGSVGVIPECWGFSADTTGTKVGTYDGTNGKANVFEWDWDNTGTMTAAPQFSAFGDSTHTTPSAGTQPGGQSGSPIVNGNSTDTSSTSYLKGALFDTFQTANLTAGTSGSSLSATAGSAGSVSPGAAAWSAFQSLQGWTQYLLARTTPAATTANDMFFTLVLYTGPNMSTSTAMLPVLTFQYSYA